LELTPGFKCIAAFDVLEHVADPLDMVRRCCELIALDGALLLQTPWYRGEGPDWNMFQADEHVHLFTEGSIGQLLERAGFRAVQVQPSLFPYDMFIVASRGQVRPRSNGRLPAAFRSVLDLSHQMSRIREELAASEADRAARFGQIEELTRQVRTVEAAR